MRVRWIKKLIHSVNNFVATKVLKVRIAARKFLVAKVVVVNAFPKIPSFESRLCDHKIENDGSRNFLDNLLIARRNGFGNIFAIHRRWLISKLRCNNDRATKAERRQRCRAKNTVGS